MSVTIPKFKIKPIIKFTVHFFVEKEEYGYIAYCPAYRGVLVDGRTKEEAVKNFKNAIIEHIELLIKYNLPIPICEVSRVEETTKPIVGNIVVPLKPTFKNFINA